MKHLGLLASLFFAAILLSCNTEKSKSSPEIEQTDYVEVPSDTLTKHLKPFKPELPTIGLLMFNGVLQGEVIATSDVFGKPNQNMEQLFNVITIAETKKPITTEEGMHFVPDYTFENCPKLTALFVPSGYDMYAQVRNQKMIEFIQRKNEETQYIVSNCAGAQLIGESGIADGHKIVTYIGGGKELQETYPNLKVQDDSVVTFVEDGKFSSSNGNLTSYISALNLVEKMTSPEHRQFVEDYLYIDRLKNWEE
ncbi:glutamine amidotransferase [Flagellimonas alvinocaridis]|uniref:Glutamine amidotransferase n=2 Tax=Pseudomonadati TaxID=3379134 RepID=A0A4S8RL23_9FLAO|nr:DJ-1/PfpI family protein [Allomuricauda alvinocaridis]THV58331.1 glutamine amidotransferase [Allomuricauda alvinocaridis]